MRSKRFVFLLSLNVILMLTSFAGSAGADNFNYQNAVYRDDIKSVQMYREGNELSFPVIELNSDAHLILKFDNLAEDSKDFYYTIIHCDADWNESFISQSEYMSGIPDIPLNDYALSFNTTMKYVNYQVSIPNENWTPQLSGNYALVVFEDNDRNNLVLIQRFYVVEPKVRISGVVKRAEFDPYNGPNQDVDFKINTNQIRLVDPVNDLNVVVMQNRRWDNAIRKLKPRFIQENELDYNYSKETVFPGGNEFRYFDIRTIRHPGENVDNIRFFRPYYHATLLPDAVRSNKDYQYYKEMNGNFVVTCQDRVTDFDTECDYVFVHFFLAMPSPLAGGTVNVFGALTGWNANKSNEMTWNLDRAGYELTLLLKQGYYNYEYVYVPEGSAKADAGNIEGSFFQTENDYQILAYYRGQGGRYDRLVGYLNVNSAVKN